jgi:phage terminase large subunit-like protein
MQTQMQSLPPQPLSNEDRQLLQDLLDQDAPTWIEKNFYIADPRDPFTGKMQPAGPIQLHPIQVRLLRAALTKVNGRFPYTTIVYSTIKKSGKTRIGAGVAAWFAATQDSYNEVYCLANDGKQSSDRILSAVKESIRLNPALDWHATRTKILLPNGTFIEAIPCDPSGSAGANPGLTVWSEMWGYRHEHKERLWSEMTVPPTRFGYALRWVESYAGYTSESVVLEDLYMLGVENGRRHPAFPDIPVYVNDAAKMLCYWDHGDAARRMPWQTAEYYQQEAAILTPSEFDRLHRNMWASATEKAIAIEWWDACQEPAKPLDNRTPVIMGVDASVSHDCCACTLISRHPDKERAKTDTMIRAVRVWEPPLGRSIDLTLTVEATVREWIERYNVLMIAYDKYQLHKMMTDIRREGIVRVYQFDQGSQRAIADKQLYDMIVHRQIAHDGDATLRAHVDNAVAKTIGEKYRFQKPTQSTKSNSRKRRPIDALVATSMGNFECLRLNL